MEIITGLFVGFIIGMVAFFRPERQSTRNLPTWERLTNEAQNMAYQMIEQRDALIRSGNLMEDRIGKLHNTVTDACDQLRKYEDQFGKLPGVTSQELMDKTFARLS